MGVNRAWLAPPLTWASRVWAWVASRAPARATPRRVLIFCNGGIGNVIMQLPAVRLLAAAFPAATIDAIVPARGGDQILKMSGNLRRILVLPHGHACDRPRDFFRAARWARRAAYDLGISFWPGPKLWAVALLIVAGVPRRYQHAFSVASARELWPGLSEPVPLRPELHDIDQNVELVQRALAAGAATDRAASTATANPPTPRLNIDLRRAGHLMAQLVAAGADQPGQAEAGSASADWVAIHPGCNPAEAFKRWPPDRFAEVAAGLRQRGFGVILVEGPGEQGISAAIRDRLLGDGGVRVLRQTSLPEVAAILSQCGSVVTSDSGIGHLAASVGTPTVTIIGPSDPARIRPRGTDDVVLTGACPVAPCFVTPGQPHRCGHRQQCLTAIMPATVIAAIEAQVNRTANRRACQRGGGPR